jgi:O-antigen biosynthesis protein WbqP
MILKIPEYRFFKRFFDISFSILLMPFFLIIAPVIIFFILVESPGNPFFFQNRVGKSGKLFLIIKFRSMRYGTPELSTEDLQKLSTSSVTFVGRFLRRTSIDEIPQIVNILLSHMSFIGPRPALPSQTYLLYLRKEGKSYDLQPGITGLAQVRGRDDLDVSIKADLDNHYYGYMSFFLDVKILLWTVFAIFTNKGNK